MSIYEEKVSTKVRLIHAEHSHKKRKDFPFFMDMCRTNVFIYFHYFKEKKKLQHKCFIVEFVKH